MDKDAIKQALRELHEEGFHIGCPWNGVEPQKIEALKAMEPLPSGAVKMVMLTWDTMSKFGQRIGQALALGLFVVLCLVLLAGAFGLGKVVQLIMGALK